MLGPRVIGEPLLKFINVWVLGTLVVFYLGPIAWLGARSSDVLLYVVFCLVAFNVGAWVSLPLPENRRSIATNLLPTTRAGARTVVGLYAVASLIYIFLVTGRSALDVTAYSLDFGAVYSEYGAMVARRQAGYGELLITFIRAVLFCLGLAIFVQRAGSDWLVSILFVGPMVVSSLFRGTDKEIVDIVVLLAVVAYLRGVLTRRAILLLGAVPVVMSLFLMRRIGRFGGDLPSCLPDSGVCFNYNSAAARWLGDWAEVLYVFLANYLTNGYQGLSYALHLRWEPNYGVGHLMPIKRALCSVSDGLCVAGDYQASLTAAGWDASSKWTSVYTPIANDLSFWLVPVYLFLLGVLMGRVRRNWAETKDPTAGAALVLIVMFWVYSSANMQIAISFDWALATILFLYLAPWVTSRKAQRALA